MKFFSGLILLLILNNYSLFSIQNIFINDEITSKKHEKSFDQSIKENNINYDQYGNKIAYNIIVPAKRTQDGSYQNAKIY